MILVAGGTGFVGSAVVKNLLERGETVAVLGRDASRVRQKFGQTVEAREADVRDAAALQQAIQGASIIIYAVQFPNSPIEDPGKGWTFEEVDYRGCLNMIEAAKANGVQRFVYISGVGAGTNTRHWFRFKYAAEQALQDSGLEWAIVRPTWVYGPDDHALNRLLGFTRYLPFLPMFGNGKQNMQPIFVDDMASIIADAALRPEAANQLFEAGGPEVMSMNDVLKTAMDIAGRSRPILHQPTLIGKALGTVASVLPKPPLSADAVDFITAPAVADTSNLQRVLSPKLTPFREGLSTYLKPKA